MSDQDRGRALRRRHMQERQAVVFGVLLACLAVAGLGSAALYTDSLSLPFLERGFSVKPTVDTAAIATYCPPEGALPVPTGQITVDVYNGAGIGGLAGTTATQLADRGFVIGVTENAPSPVTGTARIIYGASGSAAAYTLQAFVPDAVLQNDARGDALVDLIVGKEFTGLLPQEQVVLDPAAPLVGPEGCTPFAEMTAPAAPQPTGEQPAQEQPAEG
ncbi:LytR C-terminal domain-containing protein [Cellulomonas dongxiuzhuiae]|uniref:LytR C-terminal domain-containing protein n=1 Tax=Cellulomonas dongxiuzhuiae TaxID=2819979 RepID=A0ABX8GHR0_9CELL|nr:LytR C-terminal domain-containing protein [Cellulomonas dongxiuzhuiae]MBO3087917.1 LytR C-terminal domain-containing protein [Cellulomonas dongxiuzhuiae]MBO3094734.1 LytR C-terminal domain-containing protein [Cellulomonas dongxiuzhuiae]QWC15734.1 LytR C-terminal domain-containing protein [Cellulomonas dongxiuzhuiae]